MKRENTVKLAITAVFLAILILQTFVPNIGYIRILPALPAITTVPLTVAVYSSLLSPSYGIVFGLIWGLTRLIVAYTQPGDMVSLLLFRNPIIALVPSIFAGFLPSLLTNYFTQKNLEIKKWVYALNGGIASITNTVLVIVLASLFFMKSPNELIANIGNFSAGMPLFLVLLTSLGINGLIEAIFTALVTPLIVSPLHYIMKRA
ncbi:ECF transporter S component [Lactobacillus laiwuensis]|uniref:ECF transporter S component n=1 Tax=Lactobacillus laiwuensis TaxID=2841034 RepID=UPI001CC34DD5|nr:ECF transporter S component [Lactobacillus laiwuensis]